MRWSVLATIVGTGMCLVAQAQTASYKLTTGYYSATGGGLPHDQALAAAQGKTLLDMSLEEMDTLWNEAKSSEQ